MVKRPRADNSREQLPPLGLKRQGKGYRPAAGEKAVSEDPLPALGPAGRESGAQHPDRIHWPQHGGVWRWSGRWTPSSSGKGSVCVN